MTERTEWDDTIDEAIEQLIAEETDAFTLVTVEEEDVHLVNGANVDDALVAVYMAIENVRMMAREAGEQLSPDEVLTAAAHVVHKRGLLDGGMRAADSQGGESRR